METASGTAVPEAVSVSVDGHEERGGDMSIFTTRGQTDIRGLATAGRLFGTNGAAALGSGVAVGSNFGTCCCPQLFSQIVPHAAITPFAIVYRPKSRGRTSSGLVVDDRQRPTPSRKFSGYGDIGDHRTLLTGGELLPPMMQAVVAGMPTSTRSGAGFRPSSTHDLSRVAVDLAVMPCCLDQQLTCMTVAGLGDRTL